LDKVRVPVGSERRWAGKDDGVERCRVEPNFAEAFHLEDDPAVGPEAFTNHPAEWDASETVFCFVGHLRNET